MATVEELQARQDEIRERLTELDREHEGEAMPDPARAEWNELNEERERNDGLIDELEARRQRVRELAGEGNENREPTFQAPRSRDRSIDIHDLSTIDRNRGEEAVEREFRDRAMTFIDRAAFPETPFASREEMQERHETLVDRHGQAFARRVLETNSPAYRKAFARYLATGTEERVGLLTSDAQGGFAVPTTVDPTVLPTSNFSVNPYRQIARVETITTTDWQGVTSAGVTASFGTATTEASDNAPTLAGPTVTPAKAQAFIPFSIEIGQDWGALQSEMARLLQDAKDDLEADRFTFGTATTPEPEGVVKGGTAFINTASSATFAIADLYSLEEALPPRFRPRASFIGNRKQYNRVRQFDTAGGAGLWLRVGEALQNQVPTPGSLGNSLLGYPAYEVSPMASTVTTGSIILVIGDFNYFIIVDRIGLNVEVIPHLFGGSNRFPTGQRGIYAYWRTGSVVASANAFRRLTAL